MADAGHIPKDDVSILTGATKMLRARTVAETLALLKASERRNQPAIADEEFAGDVKIFREELNESFRRRDEAWE